MATQQQRLEALATAIATQTKQIRTLLNGNAADLSALGTTAKGNLVSAVNELRTAINAFQNAGYTSINDTAATSTTQTYSIDRLKSEIASTAAATKNAILGGAGAAYDTLIELQNLLQNDAASIASINTALGNRLRTDTASQALTAVQKQNARTNLDAYGSTELGNPDTDLVAVFNAAVA